MARSSKALAPLFGLAQPPQRVLPGPGLGLTHRDIDGLWHPSGAVNACGVFAIVWSTPDGCYWAALHDFTPAAQRRLIESCRRADIVANGPATARRAEQS